ncbi:hypothetical protein SDC9_168590 [bioreactor metagenome]|uniref:Uncharacterized protein n=1 Tax=bioreactor metagenome TaxID=1076179 RepID=A0A645G2Y9_9ZZZZ
MESSLRAAEPRGNPKCAVTVLDCFPRIRSGAAMTKGAKPKSSESGKDRRPREGYSIAQPVFPHHLFPRHPGLDPGSIHAAPKEWIPDQVRNDKGLKGANRSHIGCVSDLPAPTAGFSRRPSPVPALGRGRVGG